MSMALRCAASHDRFFQAPNFTRETQPSSRRTLPLEFRRTLYSRAPTVRILRSVAHAMASAYSRENGELRTVAERIRLSMSLSPLLGHSNGARDRGTPFRADVLGFCGAPIVSTVNIMLRPQTLRQYGALLGGVSRAMGRQGVRTGVHPMKQTMVHSRTLHASSLMQYASRLVHPESTIAAVRSTRSFKFAPVTVASQRVWMSTSPQKDDEDKKEAVDAFKLEKDTWAERHAPKWMVPYIQLARLNRPSGTYMLLWPCFWSISLAAPAGQLPDLGMLALFGTGALIMRSAGCTINDMWDRDFDKKVERTNQRPLASGALTYPQAWKFLALQLSAGLGVLLQLNWYSIVLGASSMALVVTYPLMKRVTYWPQAVLGLTFNYGALLGWSAVQGTCAWPIVLPMYAGGVAWTLVYDTLYAHQDKKDDQHIGVRSTALLFGDNTKPILNAFSAVTIAGLGTAGYLAGLDWPFYAGLAGGAAHLAWQVNTAKLDDPLSLQTRFSSNKWFGALIWASIVAGKVI